MTIYVLSFLIGALAIAAPFLISGHLAHLDEVARGEQTMGPGMTTFLGILAAPVGGAAALGITWWFRRRKHSSGH